MFLFPAVVLINTNINVTLRIIVYNPVLQTVKDNRMLDFFMHDFSEEKWKKAALKNAFVLMSKQRFQHAAAFFLLAGSIKDTIQV